MAIFGRRKGAKKAEEEEKKSAGASPAVKKPHQSKYVHVPQQAAADSLRVTAPSVRPDMRELVRREMTAPGSNKFVRPKLISNKSWSAGDLTIASIMEQPLDMGPARHSSRRSSFNSPHRRQPYRSTSLARSPLSNTIVEEDLSETTDESPAGSASSSDDGLETNPDQPRLDVPSTKALSIKSMPELVSEPLIDTPTTLQPNLPVKNKVDSLMDIPTEQTPTPAISPIVQDDVESSSPASTKLPTIIGPNSDLDLGFTFTSPSIDVFIESPKDDWFAADSSVSRAFSTGFLDDPKVQQWKAEEDLEAPPVPEIPIEWSVNRTPIAETSPMLDSCASSLAPESQSDVPVGDSPVLGSCASSIDMSVPPRSRRRSDINVSAPNSRSSSLVRSEQHEHIARQANAYNTVLGHLYPGGRAVSSPPDPMRNLHQSQRLSSQLQPREGRRQSKYVSSEFTAQPHRISHQPQPSQGRHQSFSVSSKSTVHPQALPQQPQPYGGRRQTMSILSEATHSQWIPYPMQEADASFARVDMTITRGRQMLNVHSLDPSMQSHTSEPQESERRSHSSQRPVFSSPYRDFSDGIVHVSRYPSSRRASLDGSCTTLNEMDDEESYSTAQQETEAMQPPPIPLASKPRFVSTYVQPNYDPRPTMQRHHTTDVYGHINQVPDSSHTNYSKQMSTTRRESFDTYARVSNTRHSSAIDDRIALAHMDSSYRQSKTDLPFNENGSSSSRTSFTESRTSHADQSSLASSKHHAYSTSEAHSISDSPRGRAYSMSSASHSLSGKGHGYTNSELSILFPLPSVNKDSDRKLTQVLGIEYQAGGSDHPPAPLNERPLLVTEYRRSESPMVTRLEYPPSPTHVPDSETGSFSEKGKKVLNMPRGTPKKKMSTNFLGMMRKKKDMAETS